MLQQCAHDFDMNNLSFYCANQALKAQLKKEECETVNALKKMMRLDLNHQKVEMSECVATVLKKGVSENTSI